MNISDKQQTGLNYQTQNNNSVSKTVSTNEFLNTVQEIESNKNQSINDNVNKEEFDEKYKLGLQRYNALGIAGGEKWFEHSIFEKDKNAKDKFINYLSEMDIRDFMSLSSKLWSSFGSGLMEDENGNIVITSYSIHYTKLYDSAIIRGEKNFLAHAYFALPISITVEGANILTRNLMQFGQGLIKSHPYIYRQINALKTNNIKAFDDAFFSHIGLVLSAFSKTIFYYLTRGFFISTKGSFKRYKQKLVWVSADFTFLSNLILALVGPALKKRENISARLADILSYSYLITATLREYENNSIV